MKNLSAVIVAGIAFLACLLFALALMSGKRFGWASVFVGGCIASAWVFALEWNDLKRAKQLKASPYTTTD